MTPSQQSFINTIARYAIKNYPASQVLPSLVIAQAALESAYGTSGLSRNYHNYFGIKGKGTAGTTVQKTQEDVGSGKMITISAGFRVYRSMGESVIDHGKLLQNARYKKVVGETDWKKATQAVKDAGYATDSKYPAKLQSIIQTFKLYEYDNQVLEVDEKMIQELNEKIKELNGKAKELEQENALLLDRILMEKTPAWAKDAEAIMIKNGYMDTPQRASYDFWRQAVLMYRAGMFDKPLNK